ncbi:hypothetical protein LPB140_10715 [Sphingorhabdus lutea]|uniref:Bile acid:sodium symporter n=1 Tax=Sphingorhabdus lutea TaxID=1913578 RepID=A0A1L3JF91_9SPHN|nr:hypothetical protein LPB140_10715 [Sphingorhabdus lutea]
MAFVKKILPDRFILMLLAALAIAWAVPVSGDILSMTRNISFAAIFGLFFLHGLRLSRQQVGQAMRDWRVQAAIFFMVFIAMPIFGWLLIKIISPPLVPQLITGIFFMTILPSTVQSAISFTSLARGNVAASVVAATLINLSAVIMTPMMLAAYSLTSGAAFEWSLVRNIALLLLLPFALGQMMQPFLGEWAATKSAMLAKFDKGVILLSVYVGFAASVASGALGIVDVRALSWIFAICAIMLVFSFSASWLLGKYLGMNLENRISILFAGAHKSIATGAPMAAILFPKETGLFLLPVIIYHIGQLIISAPLADKLAQKIYRNYRPDN